MVSNKSNNLNEPEKSSAKEENISCCHCSENLCIRQKTINLALGYTDMMYCLNCLGRKENKSAEEILAKIKKYILSRECFHKEWVKYPDISYCPSPNTCFPNTCFSK